VALSRLQQVRQIVYSTEGEKLFPVGLNCHILPVIFAAQTCFRAKLSPELKNG